MNAVIYGPTDAARDELRARFADSAREWRARADAARAGGDLAKARTYAQIAHLADRVARGRP